MNEKGATPADAKHSVRNHSKTMKENVKLTIESIKSR